MKKILRNNRGASEVVGALMLIAIVIVAASGIAVITAEMQKNEAERLSNIEAVEKENLKIMSVKTILNKSDSNLIESMNITVINLNSKDSRIAAVLVNDKAAANFTSTDEFNSPAYFSYQNKLVVPAGQSKEISMNFAGEYANFKPEYNLSTNKPVKIAVVSEYANNFMKIYNPPTPLFRVFVESENIGVSERDVLVLDASESFDDGTIIEYNWSISNGTHLINASGKKTRLVLNQKGPFNVTLHLLDDTNMKGVSKEVLVPENPRYNPPVSMTASASSYNASDNIEVTVRDGEGKPMPGVTVSFIALSGVYSLDKYVALTDSMGTARVTVNSVTTGGVLRIEAERIHILVSVN